MKQSRWWIGIVDIAVWFTCFGAMLFFFVGLLVGGVGFGVQEISESWGNTQSSLLVFGMISVMVSLADKYMNREEIK